MTGAARAQGIVINTDVADSDIATFLKYFGISRQQSIVRVAVDGGPGGFPSPERHARRRNDREPRSSTVSTFCISFLRWSTFQRGTHSHSKPRQWWTES